MGAVVRHHAPSMSSIVRTGIRTRDFTPQLVPSTGETPVDEGREGHSGNGCHPTLKTPPGVGSFGVHRKPCGGRDATNRDRRLASIIGARLARQGLGLVRGPEWPTLSDCLRESSLRLPRLRGRGHATFGNLYDVAVYVDRALGRNERIVFQAGTHSVTMSVAYADFERLARPTVADIAMTR